MRPVVPVGMRENQGGLGMGAAHRPVTRFLGLIESYNIVEK